MTLGIALIVFGAVALIAGAKNRAFADVLLGRDTTLPGGNVSASDSGGSGDPTVSSGAAPAGAYEAKWGPVHPVHVPTSLHYRTTSGDDSRLYGLAHVAESTYGLNVHEFKRGGRAFDASGPADKMAAYAQYVALNAPDVTELFWNGPGARNIKNGVAQKRWFVPGHTDHVHTGI